MVPRFFNKLIFTTGVLLLSYTLHQEINSQAVSHYVTHDGNASSNCTVGDPCTFTRAITLINNGTINDGHNVLIQCVTGPSDPCFYSQANQTITGSGSNGSPITLTFEDGAILTGARLQIVPGSWSLTSGRTYTYEAAHDQATFNSLNPMQRNPTDFDSIIVADDAGVDSRRMTLTFPPRYSNVASVDEVEAQSCTHFDNTTTVYVHMCDDEAPDTASDLWLSSSGWGTLTIQGDYITFDGLEMWHSQQSGTNGFRVDNSADSTVLRNFTFKAVGATIRGTNFTVEDGEISHVILQGEENGSGCFDSNPSVGIGECWNAGASGSAIDVGVEDSATSFGGVVRRIYVHRSWNGMSLMGANTLESSVFWGFPNHTLSFNGDGAVARWNIMSNGQDSMYTEGSDFDNITVEYNLSFNGVLFWVSRDGVGGVAPSSWTFRYNILPTIVYDDKTYPGVIADCNIYMESPGDPSANIFRITGTDGGGSENFNTLALWQAAKSDDDNSVEMAHTKWTDGTQYVSFSSQNDEFEDFHPILGAQSLNMGGSCPSRIGPLDLLANVKRLRFRIN